MKTNSLEICIRTILIAVLMLLCTNVFSENIETGYSNFDNLSRKENICSKKYILKLQDWAAEQIEKFGNEGLKHIAEKNKKLGENFILVLTDKGSIVENIVHKEIHERIMNMKDERTKKIFRQVFKEAAKKNGGWIHFQVERIGGFYEEWKIANVRSVHDKEGNKFILICGGFDIGFDDDIIVEMLNDFIREYEYADEGFYYEFQNKTEKVINDKAYLFIFDIDGVVRMCPISDSLIGRNFYDFRDCQGKNMFRDMIGVAMEREEGWIEYQWTGFNTKASRKFRVYFKILPGTNDQLIIAAGYYPEVK